MTWLVVIGGLVLLVFLHELGHFSVALAVGMRPRSFYIGFPPALAKVKHKGIEYKFRANHHVSARACSLGWWYCGWPRQVGPPGGTAARRVSPQVPRAITLSISTRYADTARPRSRAASRSATS